MFYYELKYTVWSISNWFFVFIIIIYFKNIYESWQNNLSEENCIIRSRLKSTISCTDAKCVFGVSKKLKQDLYLSNSVGQSRKKTATSSDDRQLLWIVKRVRTKSSPMLSIGWDISDGKNSICLYCMSSLNKYGL